eukprot:GFKZ01001481.1.p2 GENE.GFKZ01001481.1~~GFKZ01001481.1.p2  ORF type:complete len:158 (+),score=10.10 GFKZ01001481.1:1504-1977(+)
MPAEYRALKDEQGLTAEAKLKTSGVGPGPPSHTSHAVSTRSGLGKLSSVISRTARLRPGVKRRVALVRELSPNSEALTNAGMPQPGPSVGSTGSKLKHTPGRRVGRRSASARGRRRTRRSGERLDISVFFVSQLSWGGFSIEPFWRRRQGQFPRVLE